jgi:colanic acid/amylovoran biosynthesis protein
MWTGLENCKTFAALPNLNVIDRESQLVKLLKRVRPSLVTRYKAWLEKRCDAVVYIGGSIFMEYDTWQQIAAWWDYEAENRPLYVLGANFGPWHTEAYREKMAEVFRKCRDVCFRDQYSANLFRDVKTVRCAPDILFSYPIPKASVNKKQVFVSVIDCAARDGVHNLASFDRQYVQNMAQLLRGYLAEGYDLLMASFCREEGDEAGIRKILAAMGITSHPQIRVLGYDGTNADAMVTAIAQSAFVVSTRFHGTVLALAAGRPVLPVVYSDKMLHVLQDMEFAGTVIDLREHLLWGVPYMDVKPEKYVPQKERANVQFERLDKVLR